MAFSVGSVTAKLNANINDFTRGFSRAERSLASFGSKGKRLEDQLKSLERQKITLNNRLSESERKYGKNSIQAQALKDRVAGLTDKISTQNAKISEFKNKIDETNPAIDKMKRALNNVSTKLGSTFRFALDTAAVGVTVLTGLLGTLGGLGLKSANDFQKASLKYGTLLGSKELASERIKELIDFAAKTPFQLNDIQKADIILQGFGIRTPKILNTIGDAAAVSGSGFADLGLIIGQISQSKDLENIKQLVERGVISFDELEAAGIRFAKDRSIINSVDETYGAVVRIMEKKFGGGMDKLSNTLEGKLSTLKDNIGITLAGIAGFSLETGEVIQGSLLDVLINGLGRVISWIDANRGAIISFGQSITQNIGMAFNYLTTVAIPALVGVWNSFLYPAFLKLEMFINQYLMPAIQTFLVPALMFLYNSFLAVFNVVQPYIVPVLIVLATVIGGAVIAVVLIVAAMSVFIGVIFRLSQFIHTLLSVAFTLLSKHIDIAIGRFQTIKDAIGNFINTVKGVNLTETGKNIIQGLLNGISDMAGAVQRKAQDIADGIKNTIKDALKIQSPSKIMEQLGEFTGQGLAIGLDSSAQKVMQASNNLAGNAISPIYNTSQTINRNRSMTINNYDSSKKSTFKDLSTAF